MTADYGTAVQTLQAAERLFEVASRGELVDFEGALGPLSGTKLSEIRDSRRRTLLHASASRGQNGIVEALLHKHGLDVDAEDEEGETALALAATGAHASTVAALLAAGARPDPSRAGAAGPLHRAAGSGCLESVKQLVAAGASLSADAGSGSPLFWAAGGGHAGAVAALLAAGADPNARSRNGMTALFLAAAAAHGASRDVPGPATEQGLACVQALLQAGADVAASSNGYTPLHVAAECGNEAMAGALAAAGAPLDARDAAGNTPAELAASWGKRGTAALLLARQWPGEDEERQAARLEELMHTVETRDAARATGAGGSGDTGGARRATPPAIVPEAEEPSEELASSFKAKGTDAFGEGDYQGAVDMYSFSLRHATQDAAVWANRCAAFLKLGDFASALVDARVARTLQPKYVKAWYREGLAAEGLLQWEDAAVAFFEAYNLDPQRTAFVGKFQAAVDAGRREHAARTKA